MTIASEHGSLFKLVGALATRYHVTHDYLTNISNPSRLREQGRGTNPYGVIRAGLTLMAAVEPRYALVGAVNSIKNR